MFSVRREKCYNGNMPNDMSNLLNGVTILIADDDALIVQMYKKRWNYRGAGQ